MMHKRAALRIAIKTLCGHKLYSAPTKLRAAITLQRELNELNRIFRRKRGARKTLVTEG